MGKPDCCSDPANLEVVKTESGPDSVLVTRRCEVCERKHYSAKARPKTMGLSGETR